VLGLGDIPVNTDLPDASSRLVFAPLADGIRRAGNNRCLRHDSLILYL